MNVLPAPVSAFDDEHPIALGLGKFRDAFAQIGLPVLRQREVRDRGRGRWPPEGMGCAGGRGV